MVCSTILKMAFETCQISKIGGRKNNEDAADFLIMDNYACWVVADGLGGHSFGEMASKIAVQEMLSIFKQKPGISEGDLGSYMQYAQDELRRRQQEDRRFSDMRTTLVALVSDYENALCAHIGDSRLYYFTSGRLVYQTLDHSVAQVLVSAGKYRPWEIRSNADRNRLLSVMGMEWDRPRYEIPEENFILGEGDAFLLCTDGFWEYVLEHEMENLLAKSGGPQEWLDRMEARVLSRAGADMDNYTAIAVFYK